MLRLSFATEEVRNSYASHKSRWSKCTLCPLFDSCHKRCYVRGSLPADIVYVGEAPGESEDLEGYPFVGPAGHEFDNLLAEVPDHRYAITNVVICTPPPGPDGKIRPPTDAEINRCKHRLTGLLNIAKPKAIIAVGQVAKKSVKDQPAYVGDILHPSAILQKNGPAYGLAFKRTALRLKKLVEEVMVC